MPASGAEVSVDASYVLPIRVTQLDIAARDELAAYLRQLASLVEVIVVDGSPADVFAMHAQAWGPHVAVHCPPASDLRYAMGKVNGVLTGLRLASHDRVVIADDDVRYDEASLRTVIDLLDDADVVRPQNYFDPLPWHAVWDTGRILLNRGVGRDFPGTLGVRRGALNQTGGYDGNTMFENLELIRTVLATGGTEVAPLDVFVRRLPPTTHHFWTQRVRQAYDELARPARLVASLAILPAAAIAAARGRRKSIGVAILASIALAEVGRTRGGAKRVFPFRGTLLAPLWIAERAITSWLAALEWLRFRGVRYGDTVVPVAAHSLRTLRNRHAVDA